MKTIFALLFTCSFVTSLFSEQTAPIVKEEFLSPDVMRFDCHSSNIVETSAGRFCTVWKGGAGDKGSNGDIPQNVGVWISLFDEKGWSLPKEVVSSPESICWNPVLCKFSEEELLLFYRMGPSPRQTANFIKRSHDGGISWSREEMLPAGIIGPTKGKPIVTSYGTLICPSSFEVELSNNKATACWIEISKDGGRHWKKVGPLELQERKFGPIEPILFFDKQGRLKMLCRDMANKIGETGYIWSAVSLDCAGKSWSEFQKTSLPNPNAGIDVADLGEGKIVLVYNHSHLHRYPLNVAVSLDGGDSWSEPFVLDDTGEFPSIIVASDGLLHVTYAKAVSASGQRRIKHVVLDTDELLRSSVFVPLVK